MTYEKSAENSFVFWQTDNENETPEEAFHIEVYSDSITITQRDSWVTLSRNKKNVNEFIGLMRKAFCSVEPSED